VIQGGKEVPCASLPPAGIAYATSLKQLRSPKLRFTRGESIAVHSRLRSAWPLVGFSGIGSWRDR
jgi:hypothetical protein